MTCAFARTAAAALGFSRTTAAALVTTAEPALADSKSEMCANRMDSCLRKCDATNKTCREVCTGIWENCIVIGRTSMPAVRA